MGLRWIALALFVSFLGASGLRAEARTHESFSASSYYETDEKLIPTPKADPTETTETTVDPNSRYPNGYTGQAHHYNPVTEKYDDEEVSKTTTETNTVSTPKISGTEMKPVEPAGTIPNRYEAGYNSGHGLNPTSFPQYTNENKQDEFMFDPVEGRYKTGYYPKSTYAGAAQKTTSTIFRTTSGGVSLAAENSNQQTHTLEGDFAHRYEQGYFPKSSYTQESSIYTQQGLTPMKPVTVSSYAGQFSTMPYPNSGVPFVASGAGCRTAYWVENVHMWPSFFTVKSTVGDAFGAQATAAFGQTTILQALMKYGNDPFNELLRTGCTSLLNAYSRGAFPVSHMKVIEQFNAALVSKEAAQAQALAFETDNVESISAGSACT